MPVLRVLLLLAAELRVEDPEKFFRTLHRRRCVVGEGVTLFRRGFGFGLPEAPFSVTLRFNT